MAARAVVDLRRRRAGESPGHPVPDGKGVTGERAILEDDQRWVAAFVDKWRAGSATCATRATASCST